MSQAYPAFRQRLDAVLRSQDPRALREFLVAEGQWAPDATMDPEVAMWMMIAASQGLPELHDRADAWLASHGRAGEAEAIARRRKRQPSPDDDDDDEDDE